MDKELNSTVFFLLCLWTLMKSQQKRLGFNQKKGISWKQKLPSGPINCWPCPVLSCCYGGIDDVPGPKRTVRCSSGTESGEAECWSSGHWHWLEILISQWKKRFHDVSEKQLTNLLLCGVSYDIENANSNALGLLVTISDPDSQWPSGQMNRTTLGPHSVGDFRHDIVFWDWIWAFGKFICNICVKFKHIIGTFFAFPFGSRLTVSLRLSFYIQSQEESPKLGDSGRGKASNIERLLYTSIIVINFVWAYNYIKMCFNSRSEKDTSKTNPQIHRILHPRHVTTPSDAAVRAVRWTAQYLIGAKHPGERQGSRSFPKCQGQTQVGRLTKQLVRHRKLSTFPYV